MLQREPQNTVHLYIDKHAVAIIEKLSCWACTLQSGSIVLPFLGGLANKHTAEITEA